MALFKIFRGNEAKLQSVPYHDGYAYFTEDGQHLYIDVGNNEGDRLQVNAYAAEVLSNGVTEIDVDDIFLKTMVASVAQGGTGKNSLTPNALLVGNGTEPVKMIALDEGSIPVANNTNGIQGLKGVGAIFATTEGIPEFGVLPISAGGTGANTVTAARQNLDVYSKTESDTSINEITRKSYSTTLFTNQWVEANNVFTYTYSNAEITCGKSGDIPPIITYTSNRDEYSKIESAEATPGVGVVFTSQTKPTNDIGIIIIDR